MVPSRGKIAVMISPVFFPKCRGTLLKDEGTSPPDLINLLPSVDLPVQRCKNCSPCFFVGTSLRMMTNDGSTVPRFFGP